MSITRGFGTIGDWSKSKLETFILDTVRKVRPEPGWVPYIYETTNAFYPLTAGADWKISGRSTWKTTNKTTLVTTDYAGTVTYRIDGVTVGDPEDNVLVVPQNSVFSVQIGTIAADNVVSGTLRIINL